MKTVNFTDAEMRAVACALDARREDCAGIAKTYPAGTEENLYWSAEAAAAASAMKSLCRPVGVKS